MHILSRDEIERMISENPFSKYYRSEPATEANYKILDLFEYLSRKNPKTFVAFDLETTGLSYVDDEIIEIGAVRVIDGNIADRYHQLVNPQRSIPSAASKVNHITDDMLIDQPYLFQILADFLSFVGPYPLIAHNAMFDSRFIVQACLRYRFKYPKVYFDSQKLDEFWPDLPNRKLITMLNAAGIESSISHRALPDAESLALLVLSALNKKACLKVPDNYRFEYTNEHFTGSVELVDNLLSGIKFVVTGQIDGYERYDFEKLIASHGGRSTIKISNATDYLIVGYFPGLPDNYITSKVVYAQKLISEGGKIRIITPDEFFRMLEAK